MTLLTDGVVVDGSKFLEGMDRLEREIDVSVLTRAAGSRLLRWVNDNFQAAGIERKWPPLSAGTVANRRKGSSRPLLDTGALRRSFNVRITGNVVVVGTESEIAPHHHFGTKAKTIKAKGDGVLHFKGADGADVFVKSVNHPGIPARPLLPSAAEADRVVGDALKKLVDAKVREAFGG